MNVFDTPGDCIGRENISPGDTVKSITAAVRNPTTGEFKGIQGKVALITCEDNTVQWTCDGTAPTAATGADIGHELSAGQAVILRSPNNVKNFKVIDSVSGSAGKLKISVFG